jgi:hypothetical protein
VFVGTSDVPTILPEELLVVASEIEVVYCFLRL